MTSWLKDLFGTEKPIIAMCHFQALPGDPYFDPAGGLKVVIEHGRRDLAALQEGGVDAVMFSNEFSLPYLTRVETITVACMARVVTELLPEVRVPFGVNVLWDARASLDLAVATGASFVREVFTGAYASDFGWWDTNVGSVIRHQQSIGARGVRLLFNIVPESAAYLGSRSAAEIARSTVFNARPDILCVSGLTAGAETSLSVLSQVKQAVPDTPVFANTGVKPTNVREQLAIADGAVVGTTFKRDGVFTNPVDVRRVAELMTIVRSMRKSGG